MAEETIAPKPDESLTVPVWRMFAVYNFRLDSSLTKKQLTSLNEAKIYPIAMNGNYWRLSFQSRNALPIRDQEMKVESEESIRQLKAVYIVSVTRIVEERIGRVLGVKPSLVFLSQEWTTKQDDGGIIIKPDEKKALA